MALIRGRIYNAEKGPEGAPKANVNAKKQRRQSGYVVSDDDRTCERLADELGVSSRTIQRDGEFADAVERLAVLDSELPAKVINGELPRHRKWRFLLVDSGVHAARRNLVRVQCRDNDVSSNDTSQPGGVIPRARVRSVAKAGTHRVGGGRKAHVPKGWIAEKAAVDHVTAAKIKEQVGNFPTSQSGGTSTSDTTTSRNPQKRVAYR